MLWLRIWPMLEMIHVMCISTPGKFFTIHLTLLSSLQISFCRCFYGMYRYLSYTFSSVPLCEQTSSGQHILGSWRFPPSAYFQCPSWCTSVTMIGVITDVAGSHCASWELLRVCAGSLCFVPFFSLMLDSGQTVTIWSEMIPVPQKAWLGAYLWTSLLRSKRPGEWATQDSQRPCWQSGVHV